MAMQEEQKKAKAEMARIKAERKKLQNEQKKQKKEAKKRAKELANQEAELDYDAPGSSVAVFFVTVLLVAIWIGITVLVIKLDLGGIGTNFFAPILKDVPVLQKILPKDSITESEDVESYYGYSSLSDAVDRIRYLEDALKKQTETNETNQEKINALADEISRLKTFEANQVEFQRVKTEFYEEVVYSDKGPGIEAFIDYYETMDPETAENIYRQVIVEEEYSQEILEYAQAYSEMKPKAAAGIFEAMTDNLPLAAKILSAMQPDERGDILGAMDPSVAARITKLMEPEK
ncbi:MAG: hypothetical protein IKY53_03210 [Lachnospiraceae bacterium]|nr:hypothetical protein [Lachnospiraceae bacterium]